MPRARGSASPGRGPPRPGGTDAGAHDAADHGDQRLHLGACPVGEDRWPRPPTSPVSGASLTRYSYPQSRSRASPASPSWRCGSGVFTWERPKHYRGEDDMTALALASPLLFLALVVVLQRVEEAMFPRARQLRSEGPAEGPGTARSKPDRRRRDRVTTIRVTDMSWTVSRFSPSMPPRPMELAAFGGGHHLSIGALESPRTRMSRLPAKSPGDSVRTRSGKDLMAQPSNKGSAHASPPRRPAHRRHPGASTPAEPAWTDVTSTELAEEGHILMEGHPGRISGVRRTARLCGVSRSRGWADQFPRVRPRR